MGGEMKPLKLYYTLIILFFLAVGIGFLRHWLANKPETAHDVWWRERVLEIKWGERE